MMIETITDFKERLKSFYVDKITIKDYQELFDTMAKYMLAKLAIKVGETLYSIVEVEFYYCNKSTANNKTFNCTYKRDCKAEEWFLHYSGLDVSFATSKDKECYGGILIRGLINKDDNNLIAGPLRCANELINQCFKNEDKSLPQLVECENDIKGGIYSTIRQGIETGKQLDKIRDVYPRFAYYIEGIEWPKYYGANPSIKKYQATKKGRGENSIKIL